MISYFRKRQSADSVRTASVKRQIKLSLLYRIATSAVGFIYVPIALRYLGVEKYGIWATVLSIMSWVAFFDVGMGNGMRNKVAALAATGERHDSGRYVSTTFYAMAAIALAIFLVIAVVSPFIDFNRLLKTAGCGRNELLTLFVTVAFFTLLNFVLSLQNQILSAFHRTQLTMLNQFLANAGALIGTYLLTLAVSGNLAYLAIIYGLSITAGNLIAGWIFFRDNRDMLPSFRLFDRGIIADIGGVGSKFFVIQTAAMIIYSTDNVIITTILGPEHVTPYNVAFKLFSLLTLAQGIVIAPLWSACTDAYVKGDMIWIRRAVTKLNSLTFPFAAAAALMIYFAQDIVRLWLGTGLVLDKLLVISMGVYAVVQIWSTNYAFIINGIGTINLQFYSSIFAAIINIPLSIFFAKTLGLGSGGVMLGTVASLSLFAVIGPIQVYYLLSRPARKSAESMSNV